MANHSQQQNITIIYFPFFSSSECITWLTVFSIEAVAIVILNGLTIIVYLKERSLRKRTMYLVINQAVADMFTGASISILCGMWASTCELWNLRPRYEVIFLILVLWSVSPTASLINLGAISLERTHATFRPFKHRLVKKKIFGAVAAIVWITAGAISTGIVPQFAFKSPSFKGIRIFSIVFYSSLLFGLLTIIVSYSAIAIKIFYGTQSHHRSATSKGRKLTKTLFIVTVVSLLLTLPFIIVHLCFFLQLYTSIPVHLEFSSYFMAYANSLVNPLLYTVRIPEFKRALVSILRCRFQPQPAPAFPLNQM